MLIKKVLKFFDKLEDIIRGKLSQYPILYAFIGGIGVVLFWRGVWHTADYINLSSIVSLIIGAVILLLTGVFVYSFIGNRLIISGIMANKKLNQKEESEIKTEETQIESMQNTLERLEEKIDSISEEVEGK